MEEKRLQRGFAELVLITISILLAFSLQAWWDARREREELEASLAALRQELVAVQVELERARGVYQGTAEAALEFQKLMAPNPTSAQIEAVAFSLRGLAIGTADLPSGVLTGLLSGSSLNGVRDAQLRSRLASWPSRVRDQQQTEAQLNDNVVRFILRAMELTPLPGSTAGFEFRGEALLSDYWFETQATTIMGISQLTTSESLALSEEASELVLLIDEELGR